MIAVGVFYFGWLYILYKYQLVTAYVPPYETVHCNYIIFMEYIILWILRKLLNISYFIETNYHFLIIGFNGVPDF